MKEIKFRAYIKDESKICEESKPVFSGLQSKLHEVSTISFDAGLVAINVENANVWFPLDAVELVQYTGIVDDSNNPIYKGDIVSIELCFDEEIKCEVIYEDAAFLFRDHKNYRAYYFSEPTSMKVIGNIYENRELIYAGN